MLQVMDHQIFTYTENYTQDPAPPGYMGVGGIHNYTLTVVKSGYGLFRLVYTQPWTYDGNWSTLNNGWKMAYPV